MRKGWSIAVAIAFSLTLAGTASAQVRVAVVPFGGSGAAAARRQVQNALDGDRRVATVELDRVDSAAERVGAGTSGDEGIAGVASELEARLIVQGSISGRGRRRRIQLIGRDATGRQVGSAGGAMRGNGVARAVRQVLDEALSQLPGVTEEQAEPPPEMVSTEDETEEVPGGEDEGEEPAQRDVSDRAPLLNVQLGIIPRSRNARVVFRSMGDRSYDAWYAELGARVELRPLAGDPGLLRGLYGHFMFAHAVALGSKTPAGDPVDTTFFRLGFGVGFMLPLADIFDLGVEFGAGWDTYNLGANPLLSSAEYVYLRPALRGRVRLVRELVGIDAEIGFRPVLSRGDIGQYGPGGDTYGLDVGGGISGGVPLSGSIGITYALQLSWVSYWLGYSGEMGAESVGESATDQGVRISILVGLGIW